MFNINDIENILSEYYNRSEILTKSSVYQDISVDAICRYQNFYVPIFHLLIKDRNSFADSREPVVMETIGRAIEIIFVNCMQLFFFTNDILKYDDEQSEIVNNVMQTKFTVFNSVTTAVHKILCIYKDINLKKRLSEFFKKLDTTPMNNDNTTFTPKIKKFFRAKYNEILSDRKDIYEAFNKDKYKIL